MQWFPFAGEIAGAADPWKCALLRRMIPETPWVEGEVVLPGALKAPEDSD